MSPLPIISKQSLAQCAAIAIGTSAALYFIARLSSGCPGAWITGGGVARLRPGKAALFKLKWIDRSDSPFIGGASVMTCEDTGIDVSVESLLEQLDLVLYCWEKLGDGQMALVFVQVPSHEELWKEPFLDRGVRKVVRDGAAVYVATLDTVTALVEARKLSPPPQHLSFVFNTGRCGSTLMHRMLGKVGVLSFSEPFWSDRLLHESDSLGGDGMRALFHACMAIDAALSGRGFPEAQFFSLNFKGFSHRAMKMLTEAYPEAKHIFMYRNPIKIAESMGSIRAAAKWQKASWRNWLLRRGTSTPRKPGHSGRPMHQLQPQSDVMRSLDPAVLTLSKPDTSRALSGWADAVLTWLQCRDSLAAAMEEKGASREAAAAATLTVRMDEFVKKEDRPAIVHTVLDFVMGPDKVDNAMVEAAMSAFQQHSQAGTAMQKLSSSATSRKHLGADDIREMEQAMAKVPHVRSCDFIVPGSIGVRPP